MDDLVPVCLLEDVNSRYTFSFTTSSFRGHDMKVSGVGLHVKIRDSII